MKLKKHRFDSRSAVGTFFEEVTAKLIKGGPCPVTDGDLASWAIKAGFETKASNNNHPFRISLAQLQNHSESRIGFPYESFFYCLFMYNNRETRTESRTRFQNCGGDKTRKSLLGTCRTDDEVRLKLALGSIKVHILDIDILIALRQHLGEGTSKLLNQPETSILEISHTHLSRFGRKEDNAVFTEIGLQRRDWKVDNFWIVLPVHGDLFEKSIVIPVSTVLPPNHHRKLSTVFFPESYPEPFQLRLNVA